MIIGEDYRFAELADEPDMLDSIRSLEERLSERHGRPITLIAYEKKSEAE